MTESGRKPPIKYKEEFERIRYGHWDAAAGEKVSRRICHALERNGCKTFEDAAKISRREWMLTENFGYKSLVELSCLLHKLGLRFSENAHKHRISEFWLP